MNEVKKGNFEFVEEIDSKIYERLTEAESLAYLNCIESGSILRKVYERWLTTLVDEYRITVQPKHNIVTANDKRAALKQAHKLPTINNGTRNTFDFINSSGQTVSYPAYIGWQKFGNECHHDDLEPDNSASNTPDPDAPAATYENLMTVFKIVYKVFKAEYKRKKGAQAAAEIRPFDLYIMPIRENYVIKSYIPRDAPMSDCIREYETCSYNYNGSVDKYGIVRVFRKKSMDEIMLQLRDKEAFSEAEHAAGQINFDGNVQIDVLSRMKEEEDFYVVIYKFSSKPSRLNRTLLQQMSMADRLVLCKQISKILYSFHNLDVPIYLRNLSFDSIYIYKNKKGNYEPSIIKLDCAKMSSQEGTVVLNVENIHNLIQEERLLKYISPQTIRFIETINEIRARNNGSMKDDEIEASIKIMSDRADWASSDIYSLGVLFGDILSGQIEPGIASAAKLRSAGVDDRMGQLVMKMIDHNPECRPDLALVIQRLEGME